MKRSIIINTLVIVAAVSVLPFAAVEAQSVNTMTSPRESIDISSDKFKLVVCDGPDISKLPEKDRPKVPAGYVACDFNGLVKTVQRFIDVAMVLGVFIALVSFCYIGYLYITGTQENIKKAHSIFPKVFFGFIIMLSAWFIVYQILSWLASDNTFKALLGS